MATTKITKRERFEQIKGLVADYPELVEFCKHELELLAKKNSGEKKPTANQLANDGIKNDIFTILTNNGGLMTITDIQKSLGADFSNQRVSALVRQLIEDGKVERVEEKRKAYFKAVIAE